MRRDLHPIESGDIAVARAAGGWRDHVVVRAFGLLSEIADQPQLYTICAGVVAAGVVRRNPRLVRTGVRMIAAEWLATKGKSIIKHRVDRTRPHVSLDGGSYQMQEGSSHASELNSFPSGHTAGAVAVARAFSSEYPQYSTAATIGAVAIAAVQIPRGKHYISDLLVGAAIGLAAGVLVSKAAMTN